MERKPTLMVGGPLDGQVQDASLAGVNAIVPRALHELWTDPGVKGCDPFIGQVHYSIARITAFGRKIRIGYLGAVPNDHALWHLLVSDKAKEAAE